MKRQYVLLLVLAIMVSMGTIIFALDDEGNANDPAINERANACYEDGTMAGKCATDWEWTCGWYLIRFDSGLMSREQVPAFCESLLPALPESSTSSSKKDNSSSGGGGKCVGPIYGFAYVNFGSSNFLASPYTIYDDPDCTSTYSPGGNDLAYSESGLVAAQAICDAKSPGTDAFLLDNNVYVCNLI